MASFNLFWNPANPYSTETTQTVEYREKDDLSYTIYATIAGYKNSYVVEGLEENILYEFRIGTICDGETSYSSVVTKIDFSFPEIESAITTDTLNYSFEPDIDGDIDKYVVNLYEDGVLKTQEIYNEPFFGTLTGQFAQLNPTKTYSIETVMVAENIVGTKSSTTNVETVCITINNIGVETE